VALATLPCYFLNRLAETRPSTVRDRVPGNSCYLGRASIGSPSGHAVEWGSWSAWPRLAPPPDAVLDPCSGEPNRTIGVRRRDVGMLSRRPHRLPWPSQRWVLGLLGSAALHGLLASLKTSVGRLLYSRAASQVPDQVRDLAETSFITMLGPTSGRIKPPEPVS
jgi:hypothetical protein